MIMCRHLFRVFLRFCLLLTVAIGGLVCLESLAAAPRTLPSFGVVFNDDADLAYVVPDRARSEALLTANVAALADTPVKTLVYCIGMGGDLVLYPTRVASEVGWRHSDDEKPGSLMAMRMENARVCIAQGADAVRTAGVAAKRYGLLFIPSLRMNDAHFMSNPDGHAMTSSFWLKNRDRLTIKDSPLAFQKAYGNLLDYSHAEVRQHRLDAAFEAIARNEDLIDGFEFDFNRFQVFFPRGKAESGAPEISDMVRQLRERLDEVSRRQQRPMYLFVRIPPSLADARTAGLDVETWMEKGWVDLVSPAQIMTLAGDMPIADLIKLGQRHGVKIYPSLYPRTSWRIPYPSLEGVQRYHGLQVGREATLEEIRGAAAGYFAQGVDGFYLFNFYNAFGSTRPYPSSLYQVLRDTARVENGAGEARVYAVTKSYYHDGVGSYAYAKQLPAVVKKDQTLTLNLVMGETPATSVFPLKESELRLGLRGLSPEVVMTVSVNGSMIYRGKLPAGFTWETRTLTGVLPKQPDAAEKYVHIPISEPSIFKLGSNHVSVALSEAGASTRLTDCEVRFAYHNDLEKLWRRESTPLN